MKDYEAPIETVVDDDMETDGHPLFELLNLYMHDYKSNRANNDHLNNLMFHRNFGLYLDGPVNWPHLQSVKRIIEEWGYAGKVMVVYNVTADYKRAYEFLNDDAQYLAWHEMYYAINTVNQDSRPIKRIRENVSNAELTVCIGVSHAPSEVIEHIRTYSDNCLILFG